MKKIILSLSIIFFITTNVYAAGSSSSGSSGSTGSGGSGRSGGSARNGGSRVRADPPPTRAGGQDDGSLPNSLKIDARVPF